MTEGFTDDFNDRDEGVGPDWDLPDNPRWTMYAGRFTLSEDPLDISQWIQWVHVPSCPCFKCEDYRRDNGLSCMYGVGPRPEESPEHNWEGQRMFAEPKAELAGEPQVDSPDSGGETKHESGREG